MYSSIDTPDYQELDLEGPQYAGDVAANMIAPSEKISVSPVEAALMQASTVGPSEMANVSTDPRLKDAQLAALSGLEGISEAGGMTGVDNANMQRMISQVGQQDRGRREAIDQQMARRGMGGSGMDLLAKLSSSQAATDRASQQGLDIQGMAQARALEALMQGGRLGGQIRGQDFGEQSAKAQAQDAISRFNAAQTQGANQANMGATNQFSLNGQQMDFNQQAQNIGNANSINAANSGILNQVHTGNRDARQGVNNLAAGYENQSQVHNKYTMPTQNFQNQMNKTDGMTSGTKAVADQHSANAAGKDAAFQGAVTGGATAIGAAYGGPAGAAAAGTASKSLLEEEEK